MTTSSPTIVALIPARGGSKRVPRKNLQELGGHPLLAHTINAAKASGIFSGVYVSTEDAETMEVARAYGASVILRPDELAADLVPDLMWVKHALTNGINGLWNSQAFSILRPTSPFRSAESIRAAWEHFSAQGPAVVDSLRAVAPCRQHPFKMWRRQGALIVPFSELVDMPALALDEMFHSMPTQAFPEVLAQTAALEIAWTRVVLRDDPPTISGRRVIPWELPGYESFDINTEEDLKYARWLVDDYSVDLPEAC